MMVLKNRLYVLKFVSINYGKTFMNFLTKVGNIFNYELLWLKEIQWHYL